MKWICLNILCLSCLEKMKSTYSFLFPRKKGAQRRKTCVFFWIICEKNLLCRMQDVDCFKRVIVLMKIGIVATKRRIIVGYVVMIICRGVIVR